MSTSFFLGGFIALDILLSLPQVRFYSFSMALLCQRNSGAASLSVLRDDMSERSITAKRQRMSSAGLNSSVLAFCHFVL